jgi:hypothetical protein
MKPLLLVANESECKYIDYDNIEIIGLQAVDLNVEKIKKADNVVLFGCSGYIEKWVSREGKSERVGFPYDMLIAPNKWYRWGNPKGVDRTQDMTGVTIFGSGYTANRKVDTLQDVNTIIENHSDVFIVDQESSHVGEICNKYEIPFISVRYIIDKCHKKCMPIGINHFWRKFQHKRMQQKMSKVLNDIRV